MTVNIKNKKGFTLIELLVVISIIGILAALIMTNFNAARGRARDAQRKSDLRQISTSLRMYYNDNNLYPLTADLTFGSDFSGGEMIYMKYVPHDPSWEEVGDPDYVYSRLIADPNDYFCLVATLENASDGDIAKTQLRCSGCGSGNQYAVCAE